METKICKCCHKELPLSEFNKNRNSKDGLQDKCRACFSEYNKARYKSDPERFREAVKRYRASNKANVFETRLNVCKKHPTRENASRVIDEGVRAGIIKRPDHCSGCGCSDKEHRIEAHHNDYSKPLDVIWLCTPCHRALDARRRVNEGKTPYGIRGNKQSHKESR